VLILEHGGNDLEHLELLYLTQAKSIIFQVIVSLHWAETHYEFEHRDLHLSNILLKKIDDYDIFEYILKGENSHIHHFFLHHQGVKIMIIDYTLS
jgi:serine/threonine-protein kinase haspin